MKKIAVTGGIASGKSTVLSVFGENSVPTIDCDSIVDKLYSDKSVCKQISSSLGTCDRKELARKIFSAPIARQNLEAILHSLVLSELKQRLSGLESSGEKAVAVDVPLLFEAGWQNLFDKVVVVLAPHEKRVSRLVARGFSEQEAEAAISSQMPQEEKLKKSDYAIDNSKSLASTEEQVLKILRDLDD